MISTESLTAEWIEAVSKELKYPDKGLLEKTIRALSLLELLVKANCPLCFKGGSALLLLLRNTLHRISIDVDIICPPGTDINLYLEKLQYYGFTRVIPTGAEHPGGNIPVSHSKVFFEIAYNPTLVDNEGYIRLDVLYENIPYSKTEMVPIEHPVLKTEGKAVMVQVPTKEDILGDKLTAFGPNSIGIPYEKRGRNCSLEIVKQLFDIGRLFDNIRDFNPAYESFKKVSSVELGYRGLDGQIDKYFEDVRKTAICIGTRGLGGEGNFSEISRGLSRIKSFMFQKPYLIESAITDAAKTAYLATCFQYGQTTIEKYAGPDSITTDLPVYSSLNSRLQRLKSRNPEAYFYWVKTGEMLEKILTFVDMDKFYIKPGWMLNPNEKVVAAITKRIEMNGGECPCHNDGYDKKCPCSDYREKDICHCTLYLKKEN